MLDKYIKIGEKTITCGQTSSGIWYCKELPAENPKEADKLIGQMNTIFNKYNKVTSSKEGKKEPSPPSSLPGVKM